MGDIFVKEEPVPEIKAEIESQKMNEIVVKKEFMPEIKAEIEPILPQINATVKEEPLSEIKTEIEPISQGMNKTVMNEEAIPEIKVEIESLSVAIPGPSFVKEETFEYIELASVDTNRKSKPRESSTDNENGRKRLQCDGWDYDKTRKQHMKHNVEKCVEYTYSTSRKSNLIYKTRTHTRDKVIHMVKQMVKHAGEKPFQCDECDYSASQKSQLKRHMMTHTEEMRFQCESDKHHISIRRHAKKRTSGERVGPETGIKKNRKEEIVG